MTDHRHRPNDSSVTHYDGDRDAKTDNDSQVTAIVKAFFANPVGAVEVVMFIAGLVGVYWAIQGEIRDVKADSESHYTQFTNKLEGINTGLATASARMEALYNRGDVRYTAIMGKLGEHDVDIARMSAGVDFLVKQADRMNGMSSGPHEFLATPQRATP